MATRRSRSAAWRKMITEAAATVSFRMNTTMRPGGMSQLSKIELRATMIKSSTTNG